MNMGMTGGESSLRDKDVAAIRKILAGCAKRATERLPRYARLRSELARRRLGLDTTIAEGEALLASAWHPDDGDLRAELETLIEKRRRLAVELHEEEASLEALRAKDLAAIERLESWVPAPTLPEASAMAIPATDSEEKAPSLPETSATATFATESAEAAETPREAVIAKDTADPVGETRLETVPDASAPARPSEPEIDGNASSSPVFASFCETLARARTDADVAALSEEASTRILELRDAEIVRLLSRLLGKVADAACVRQDFPGCVTPDGRPVDEPAMTEALAALRERARERAPHRGTIATWLARLEQEALDIETHAQHYPESLALLIIQKIAFDGKRLTVTFESDLTRSEQARLFGNVFGKLRATKGRVSETYLDGLAKHWNSDKSDLYWTAEIARLDAEIAKRLEVRGPASQRPAACPATAEGAGTFDALYASLRNLLDSRSAETTDADLALRELVHSVWKAAKGNPVFEDVLARLMRPHGDLISGRELRHLRRVIEALTATSDSAESSDTEDVKPSDGIDAPIPEVAHPSVVRARAALEGRRAVLIGGERREERASAIREAFGLEAFEWIPVQHKQGLSDIERVRRRLADGGLDFAWILLKYAPHAVTGGLYSVRDKCANMPQGYGLVALAEAFLRHRDGGHSSAAAEGA